MFSVPTSPCIAEYFWSLFPSPRLKSKMAKHCVYDYSKQFVSLLTCTEQVLLCIKRLIVHHMQYVHFQTKLPVACLLSIEPFPADLDIFVFCGPYFLSPEACSWLTQFKFAATRVTFHMLYQNYGLFLHWFSNIFSDDSFIASSQLCQKLHCIIASLLHF